MLNKHLSAYIHEPLRKSLPPLADDGGVFSESLSISVYVYRRSFINILLITHTINNISDKQHPMYLAN